MCFNRKLCLILSVTNIRLMRLIISSSKQMQHLWALYSLLYCEGNVGSKTFLNGFVNPDFLTLKHEIEQG